MPGDTTIFLVTINNLAGAGPVENIQAQISTDNNLISILDGEYIYLDPISSGSSFDCQFMVTSSENISIGNIPLDITITADLSGNFPSNINFEAYSYDSEIYLPFGFYQEGYPLDILNINQVSLFTDLYGNSPHQIYFSSDSILYGKYSISYSTSHPLLTLHPYISTHPGPP